MQEMLLQFVPAMIIGLAYAVVVFLVARKRHLNPWGWTIGTLIPFFGLIVGFVFMVSTVLSILDRLNAIEALSPLPAAQ